MYAIGDIEDNLWFNVELDSWVSSNELDGSCLFPTKEMAQNIVDTDIQEDLAKVFMIDLFLPQ